MNIHSFLNVFFTDLKLSSRASISVTGNSGVTLHSHTKKFMHYQTGNPSATMYYSRTLIHLKKLSSNPNFIYYEMNIDDSSGDLVSYPSRYNYLYLVAYGINGNHNVRSDIYD